MSKKLCRNRNELEVEVKGRRTKYICAKCDNMSPKEKWLCYVSPIEEKKKKKKKG